MIRGSLKTGVAAAATALFVAAPVFAWSYSRTINARVNQHVFHRVTVQSDDCKLKIGVYFDAPKAGYDSGAKQRNHHRFKVRYLFANGKTVVTPVIGNAKPGKRRFVLDYDSGEAGCWAKDEVQLKDVDIEGCRGRGCKVKEFSRVIPEY